MVDLYDKLFSQKYVFDKNDIYRGDLVFNVERNIQKHLYIQKILEENKKIAEEKTKKHLAALHKLEQEQQKKKRQYQREYQKTEKYKAYHKMYEKKHGQTEEYKQYKKNYNKNYYESKKNEIKNTKRNRIKNDPAYKKKINEINRKAYWKKKGEKQKVLNQENNKT